MGDESISKDQIRIVGTHHFMEESIIRKEIEDFNPDMVLIELCNGRITLIEHPELEQKQKPALLGLISKVIKKKADKEGKEYGIDMKSAYKISKEKEIPVGLIDRPIIETSILFKAIPLREKILLLNELRKLSSKDIKIEDIIKEVENTETEEIVNKIKAKCPNLHYYVISLRDEYMINKIKAYLYDSPDKRILIFVGDGHKKTIENNIKLNEEVKDEIFERQAGE